jgi:hypothetical protein
MEMKSQICKKASTYTFLVRTENSVVIVETACMAPQNKHRVTLWLSNSTPRYLPKRGENRDINTFIQIAALFTTARRWKQISTNG